MKKRKTAGSENGVLTSDQNEGDGYSTSEFYLERDGFILFDEKIEQK